MTIALSLFIIKRFTIFEQYLNETDASGLSDIKSNLYDKEIWKTLFTFQQHGVRGAINKILKYNGCIIADSVGLGKTYEALAVIKYFEMLNYRVLVLTPKKLKDNWTVYQAHKNHTLNPFPQDRFSYTVMYHTDLSREKGFTEADNIYLAAIKIYPPAASDLKVLYLDDIFIGLNTNNRIPLLKILKNEFIANDFQVFISTYDRQWFEASRVWFEAEKCFFKCLELFVNDDDANPTTPDIPVIIDPSNNLFENAIKHFEAKDFPAAANYLRKTCEAELKRILPRHLILKINFQTDEVEIHKLEKLIDNFFDFLAKNNLNAAPFVHFKTYKKIVFNPLSHDDLEAPHYRREIGDGIQLVKDLQKLKAEPILLAKDSVSKPMKLGVRFNGSRRIQNYILTVLEDLQLIQ